MFYQENSQTVQSKNSSANTTFIDVIGNKTDDEDGTSLYSQGYIHGKHIHSPGRCYPTLANGVTVSGGDGAWQLGNFTEIVPANTITSPFDIHWLNISQSSAADTYQLELYYGEANTFAGCIRFTRAAGAAASSQVVFQSPIIPANSKVTAKIASSSGGDNSTLTIHYHTY